MTARLESLGRRMGSLLPILAFATSLAAQTRPYSPPAGRWETRPAAAVGMDSAKLAEAVRYALANGSDWDFARDQVRTTTS